jgi:GTP 3',8-cyclase
MNLQSISLRLSVTDSCQFHCVYCRSGSESSRFTGRKLESEELCMLVRLIHSVVGISKLRLTGGEPLLRQDLPGLVRACTEMGIEDLALTTNGQQLAETAGELTRAGLRRVNISLDSLDGDIFSRITQGGDLSKSLAGIDAALKHGLRPVKLNMVVMRGVNDHEIGEMLDFARQTGCHIRFLELMPIGVAARNFDRYFVSSQAIYDWLAERFTLRPLDWTRGATSRNFLVDDVHGRSVVCGLISPTSDPFCHGCRRLRLTDDGRLWGCLARRRFVDLGPALSAAITGDRRPLTTAIADALAMKDQPHDLTVQSDMARIGG